jgi:RNA 3'-terminal phosphate cyclase (ATP)
MLEINGSYGEGGGQIVRSAISLAAVTGTPVRITQIRANRNKPGLARQHITAIHAVAELCNGEYTPLRPGVDTLEFTPGKLELDKKDYLFDMGTAGSITLVLQACMPLLAFRDTQGEVEIKIRGGTDVNWSPPIDYFTLVFLENLKRLGIFTVVTVNKRGYYPKGGGEVSLRMQLDKEITDRNYRKLNYTARGELKEITGVVTSRMLPDHIPHRILQATTEKLKPLAPINIQLDSSAQGFSAGTGIVVVAKYEGGNIGASALGVKGLPAEQVGANAATALKTELEGSGVVDIYAADQLIPYLAILHGTITVREISLHTKTNLWLVEQFIGDKFNIEQFDNAWSISI